MTEKPTDEMDKLLENATIEDFDDYYNRNKQYLKDDKKAFYHYYTDVVREKGLKLKDIYINADVSESFGGQIVRQEKGTKNRDLIIRLCMAAHFSLEETNRALKLYGFNELYSKISRDALILLAIKGRRFDLYELNDLLREKGYEPLSESE